MSEQEELKRSVKQFSRAIKKLDDLAASREIDQGKLSIMGIGADTATDLLYDIGCLISILGTTAANISISLSKSIQGDKATKKRIKKNEDEN